ncbi:MAG: hypothetical protein EXR62_12880 [Chloroflexi bacterium]|nr:hypothetical protein [Chloroflexota bacterium]
MQEKSPDWRLLSTLAGVEGMTVIGFEITPNGILINLEDAAQVAKLLINPKIYADKRVLVDPVNDFVILIEVRRYKKLAQGFETVPTFQSTIEVPFSRWYSEHKFQ